MQKLLRVTLLFALTVVSALAQREIGPIDVAYDSKTIPVRVSGNTPELNALALQAFGSHGLYKLVASGYAYDIKFSQVTGTQVRVDVTKGTAGTPVSSDVANGTSSRNALLRAADVAVAKTNGRGLKGYFSARLTFISERTGKKEIYTSDLFFGEVKQVTRDNALALFPRWAPDGNRIIYTSYFKSGFPDIFLIDLATGRRDTFVSLKGTNQAARFSPNGAQVAMVLSGEGTPEIYTCDARGPKGTMITRKTRSDAVKSSPCWSPDGSRLVFASDPGPQLYVMSAAGGTPSRVSSGISNYCAEPDWSRANPDKIAFTIRVGRNYQIAVLSLSTRSSEQVSKAPFDGIEPSWLGDGRHVVYTARTARDSKICILDTETGKSVPVTPSSFGTALQANVWTP